MPTSKDIYVVAWEEGWVVRREDASRATSIHKTQRAAIQAAREIARNQNSGLVIHGRDGRVRDRISYSRERLAPRTPKVIFPVFKASRTKKEIIEAVRFARESRNGVKVSTRSTPKQQ